MTHVCSCPRQYELGQEQSRQDKVIEVTSFVISNHAVWLRSTSSIRLPDCAPWPALHPLGILAWRLDVTDGCLWDHCGLMGLRITNIHPSFVFVFLKSLLFAKSFAQKVQPKSMQPIPQPGLQAESRAQKQGWHWTHCQQAMNFIKFHISYCLTFPPAFESHEPRVSALRPSLLVAIHIIVIIGAGPCQTKGWLTAADSKRTRKNVEGCRLLKRFHYDKL